jgi:hypothetical protein
MSSLYWSVVIRGNSRSPFGVAVSVQRIPLPTRADLESWLDRCYKGVDTRSVFDYLGPDEYSYRRVAHCVFLQLQAKPTWDLVIKARQEERLAAADPKAELVPVYQAQAYHPEAFLKGIFERDPDTIHSYGECLDVAGSVWAFVSSALSRQRISTEAS